MAAIKQAGGVANASRTRAKMAMKKVEDAYITIRKLGYRG